MDGGAYLELNHAERDSLLGQRKAARGSAVQVRYAVRYARFPVDEGLRTNQSLAKIIRTGLWSLHGQTPATPIPKHLSPLRRCARECVSISAHTHHTHSAGRGTITFLSSLLTPFRFFTFRFPFTLSCLFCIASRGALLPICLARIIHSSHFGLHSISTLTSLFLSTAALQSLCAEHSHLGHYAFNNKSTMALEITLPKSKALTLSSLVKHDDIITDALVDRVCLRVILLQDEVPKLIVCI